MSNEMLSTDLATLNTISEVITNKLKLHKEDGTWYHKPIWFMGMCFIIDVAYFHRYNESLFYFTFMISEDIPVPYIKLVSDFHTTKTGCYNMNEAMIFSLPSDDSDTQSGKVSYNHLNDTTIEYDFICEFVDNFFSSCFHEGTFTTALTNTFREMEIYEIASRHSYPDIGIINMKDYQNIITKYYKQATTHKSKKSDGNVIFLSKD